MVRAAARSSSAAEVRIDLWPLTRLCRQPVTRFSPLRLRDTRTPPLPLACKAHARRASFVMREMRRSASTRRSLCRSLGRSRSMAAASASAHCEIASGKIQIQMYSELVVGLRVERDRTWRLVVRCLEHELAVEPLRAIAHERHHPAAATLSRDRRLHAQLIVAHRDELRVW